MSFTDYQLITIVKSPHQVAQSVKSISDINDFLCSIEPDTCFMQKISFQIKEKKTSNGHAKGEHFVPLPAGKHFASVLLLDCPFIEFPEKHYCLIYPPCCLNGI